MRTPRVALLALVGLSGVVCASCSAPDAGGGTAAGDVRAQCVVGDEQGEVIVLPGSLTADADLVLEGAAPEDAVNLEVVEQAVVAFAGRSTVQGVITDYPPAPNADLADSLAHWSERRPLAGLTLSPDDGQQAVLVALRLVDPGSSGHLDGVTVAASSDGESTERSFPQPLLVEPAGDRCTVEDVDATREWVEG